jgi:hypothetical protein
LIDLGMKHDAQPDCAVEQDTQARTRACLICKKHFQSEWAGERICRPCKSTAAWRSGALGQRT